MYSISKKLRICYFVKFMIIKSNLLKMFLHFLKVKNYLLSFKKLKILRLYNELFLINFIK